MEEVQVNEAMLFEMQKPAVKHGSWSYSVGDRAIAKELPANFFLQDDKAKEPAESC